MAVHALIAAHDDINAVATPKVGTGTIDSLSRERERVGERAAIYIA